MTLAWLAKTTSPYDHLAWAIADQAKDQCFGMVNYHHREARNKRLELGYFIAPRHQGQGFGTEAVQAVLDYCAGSAYIECRPSFTRTTGPRSGLSSVLDFDAREGR
jgi:RimJ/RimL family protein N-acetyltransferase